MAGKKTQAQLTPEEKLQQALVPTAEQPYKVPANWCWTRLGIVSIFERGITFPASGKEKEKSENNLPCIRTTNIQEELELEDLIYIDKKYIKNNENKLVKTNDIIMSSANSRELVGKVIYVHNIFEPMTFGGFVLVIRTKDIFNKFLFYFLRLEFLAGHFMGKSAQTTNIANISTANLSSYCIPLPPLPEQQRIVERIESLFAKLDEAKENLQNVLDGFETRKAAILHKAFTGELTANWRKQHGVSMESWVITTLKDVCLKITDGTHNSPVNTPIGEYMYITAKNIKETGVDLSNITFVSKDVHNEIYSRCDVQYGDVLYIKDGATTGIATVNNIEIPFSLLSSVAVLRPNKKIILAKYMAYNLNSSEVKSMMINNMSGNAITRLTLTKIKAAIIKICSLEEQAEIVRIIDDLLAKEQQANELSENALAKIDLIKKAILARAFRGELGTNNPADESAVELLKRVL